MHYHYDRFHFFSQRELNELYLSLAIRSFAISMVAVFIPLYLIQAGHSLASVFIFYIFLSIGHGLGVIPATKISAMNGFKHAVLFSVPLLSAAFLMLRSLAAVAWPLWLIGILYGFAESLFWMGFHVDFAKFSSKKRRGIQVGAVHGMNLLVQALGPAVGGILAAVFGFKMMFVIVAVLLFIAALPLFLSKNVHSPVDCSIGKVLKGQSWKNFLSFFARGIEGGAAGVLWPTLIFFKLMDSYSGLGLLRTTTIIVALVFTLLIGRFADTYRSSLLRIGSVLNMIVWTARGMVGSVLGVFAVDSAYGATTTIVSVPFEAKSYDKAAKDIVHFTMFREMGIHAGGLFLFLCMLAVSELAASLFFGGGASLLYLLF